MSAIWQFIANQQRFNRLHFGVGILVALIPAAAGILLLGVSGWFITAAAIAGLSGAFLNIFAPSAIIRALAIIRTAGRYGERLLTHDATFRFLSDLRNRLFGHYASGLANLRRTGTVLNRLTSDIDALDTVYLRLVVPSCLFVAVTIALLIVWATVSPPVFATGLVFVAAWALLVGRSLAKPDRKSARRADAAIDAMRLRATDLAAARRDLAVYGGLEKAAEEILVADERLADAEEVLERRANRLVGSSNLIGQTFLAFMLLACAWGVAEGDLALPHAVGLVLVVMALPEMIAAMLPGLAKLPRTALAARRTVAAQGMGIDATRSVKSAVAKQNFANPAQTVLRFDKVTFGYPGAAQPILDGFSLDVRRGEIVAIAGRSGCGKSTLAALAARLQFANTGSIKLNGADIASLSETDLRRAVTMLSQRPYLFNDTVAANLRLAAPESSDADLWQALEHSALSERIALDADGLQTLLGEGGLGLSGGEQRRLALARAFLKRPSLFILDEMTEGLDDQMAADVLNRFLEFRTNEAVLMIAHKKRELDLADRIVNLTGTPES